MGKNSADSFSRGNSSVTDPIVNFDDIRPYHDDEVAGAVQRIIADPDFIHAIIRHRLGSSASWLNTNLAAPFFQLVSAPALVWF